MNLLWPLSLLSLAIIPLLVGIYIWALRRRRRYAIRYSSLSLVRAAVPSYSRWRRHLPFALMLLALASLGIAAARPTTVTTIPAGKANIILTIDISRSMLQMDVLPSRLVAAEEAALSFVKNQDSSTQIGVVAFAGFAQLIQPPTNDQRTLRTVIESLTTGRGTAIGSGILVALDAIAEVNSSASSGASAPGIPSTGQQSGAGEIAISPSDIIVLLTDGVTTMGPEPLDAAQRAREQGIRVYTIGFGTEMGGTMYGYGDPNWGGGTRFRRGIDEETLKQIAEITGGEYFQAKSAAELQEVFATLPSYLITREELMEVSVLFAAVGAVLAFIAIVLSQVWNPLP
ncbi:MAG TPA: VWA domain-containing protein [Anaerolineaceae bacterium]|nr:VWA domain-containing protein [Anaerolineaceae bacterium]